MLIKQAVGYVRVSTRKQSKEGLSLPEQREKIRLYCRLKGLDLGRIYEDTSTGANLKRPGIQELVSRCEGNYVSDIVVTKLDRLSRRTLDSLILIDKVFKAKDITFHSLAESVDTSTPHGKLFFTLVAAFSEMERSVIAERIRTALNYRKANNLVYGQVPYGMRREGSRLVKNGDDHHLLRRISALRRHLSLRQVAERLNKENLTTKNGKEWSVGTVFAAAQGGGR